MILKSRRNLLILSSILVLILSACTSATQTPPAPSVNDEALTIVALTFQAATQSAELSTPTALPSPAATPTVGKPVLYINGNVKCRTGTSPNFKVVTSFVPGTTVEMVGKDPAVSAWLVRIPVSMDTCWILAQDASPSGDYQNLPVVTPQPSTQQLPSAPAGISWPYICTYAHDVVYQVTVNLSWMDPTRNANGFRVYRQDTLIADLPADTTAFTDKADVTIGSQLTYSVEAYNDAGVSPRGSITINSICKK